ncbi:hypothetical protein FQZ97_1116990 [compost metagenome]
MTIDTVGVRSALKRMRICGSSNRTMLEVMITPRINVKEQKAISTAISLPGIPCEE